MNRFQKSSKEAKCEHFIGENSTRFSLKPRSHKFDGHGNVLYGNVLSPIPTTSFDGARYFCTFSDEYSGCSSIEIIRRKHEYQKASIMFSVGCDRQFYCSIKILHTDLGRALTVMDEYFIELGIRHE